MTAQIIPFPTRAAAAGDAGQLRLQRALRSLDEALTAQRAAIAEWRHSLATLRTTMGGLGDSVRQYHDSLGELDTKVSGLRAQAVALEQWADDTIAREAGAAPADRSA